MRYWLFSWSPWSSIFSSSYSTTLDLKELKLFALKYTHLRMVLSMETSVISMSSTFILGSAYALLALWMVLEYFIITWPHFVLPKFLYKLCSKLMEYRLRAPLSM
jgi:hypothetical protein